jgi:hypothetical protein
MALLTKEEKVNYYLAGKKYGDYVTVARAFGLSEDYVLKIAKGKRNNEKVLDALVALVAGRETQPAQ